MAAVVDGFDLLFRQVSNGFHIYSEVLSLIGAYYVTKKVIVTCYRVQYVIRMHLYPKLRPKRDLVKEFGEWAVVTGSTDGIGKAYAMELAHHGVNIILISRSNEKLRKVASEIESFYGVKTHVIKADFSLGSEIYEDISTKLQGMQIGILVNNVGAMDYPQLFLEMDADRIRQLININIGAATMMTKLVLPQMVERKCGVVVNVSSGTSIHPSPQLALYSACKTYVDVFSQALEYEYKDYGIIVQTLLPSYVATKMADFGETMPRSRFLIPSAAVYAKHAVASIGIANRTAGYWPHAVQSWIARQIPRNTWMWGANILNSALRRQAEVRRKLKIVKSSSKGKLASKSPTAESASKSV
ncbi:inactive hydroxysteroid dehydrogenase-like protein 1 [Strongylocentrotus purpuratus]|uniref:Inactive hydroxysteroid dehydrogenase-like protein 1 n=1 Tax=Strongylocentrotus purpuratus TaxID=7668 RepID=A0A7M7RFW9_STRPU|nr:inactive hydroxysteroid dehydrogenase-like protein 1 [Strongylocentrotus purpuratus]|eukprot:XP_788968.2 PREDICTED: inactive hydroxysteroid dehydrogenase-like protein 1 [Strongylocentrotus purpuratus]